MMLPLEKRTNRLLSVLIRAISLEYTQYMLQINASEGKSFYSAETERTMLPKFDLDRHSKEMSKFLLSTDETNMKFILLKSQPQQEKIFEFGVEMGDLLFLCKDMSKAKIKSYPIIIFEFLEGFYTTRDLYINNTYNYQLEVFNNPKAIGLTQSLVFNTMNHYANANINLSASVGNFPPGLSITEKEGSTQINQINQTNTSPSAYMTTNTPSNTSNSGLSNSLIIPTSSNSSTPQTTSKKVPKAYNLFANQFNNILNKKEIKFSLLNEKFKQYEFFDKQLKIINVDKSEKIKQLNNKLQITNEALSKFYKKYQMILNLDKLRKQALSLTEKIQNQENTIENIKKIISQKQSDLHISSSIFFLNKENYKDKVEYIEKNYKKIEKYKIMYNAFKNKKLIESTCFFLNRICYKFYLIPPFYNQMFDLASRIQRYQYYEKNTKELAVMLGSVANLINYLSKLFNIPMKYPMFINGSKSFIVKDKKDFVALYSVPKNEDRNSKLEQAMEYLQDNMKEVMKYFHISNLDCDKGVTKTPPPGSLSINPRTCLPKNIFSDFIILSNFLKNLAIGSKLHEDV